jgi:hypothetical protein
VRCALDDPRIDDCGGIKDRLAKNLKRLVLRIFVENDIAAVIYIIGCGSWCATKNLMGKIMSKEIFGKLSSKEQDLVLRGPARLLIIEMKRNGIDAAAVPKNKRLSDVKPGCVDKTKAQIEALQNVRDNLLFDSEEDKIKFSKWLGFHLVRSTDPLRSSREVRSIIEACPVPAAIRIRIAESFFVSMQFTEQTIYEYRTGANIAKCAHGIVKQVGAEIAYATQQKAA